MNIIISCKYILYVCINNVCSEMYYSLYEITHCLSNVVLSHFARALCACQFRHIFRDETVLPTYRFSVLSFHECRLCLPSLNWRTSVQSAFVNMNCNRFSTRLHFRGVHLRQSALNEVVRYWRVAKWKI